MTIWVSLFENEGNNRYLPLLLRSWFPQPFCNISLFLLLESIFMLSKVSKASITNIETVLGTTCISMFLTKMEQFIIGIFNK